MIKEAGILILIIFLFSEVSASCNETQIDINTANLTELDSLIGIGPAKAQAIIDSRSFSSLDDLIRVSGIGNATLNKIKEQGLACVNEEVQKIQNNVSENNSEKNNNQVETNNTQQATESNRQAENAPITSNTVENVPKSKTETINLAPISLNSQDIKSENNNENLVKNLPLYGIIGFCVLFGALFLLKQISRRKENEFR